MSNCLNCTSALGDHMHYCSNCGAKIVSQRITLKRILSEVAETILGWDNKYFFTLRALIIKPHIVLEEYVSGVRKKYVHPFTFLIIGATLTLFTFTFLLDNFVENLQAFNMRLVERYKAFGIQEWDLERVDRLQAEILKYFNIVTLLFIPLYSLLTYIIYRKTYNYAEHLIFNAYARGTIFIITLIFFYLSLITHPILFFISTLATWFVHAYIFGRLHNLGIVMSILKLVLFNILLSVSIIILLVLMVLVMILIAYIN